MDRRTFFAALAGLPFLRWLKPKYAVPCNIVSNRVECAGPSWSAMKCDAKPHRVVSVILYRDPGPLLPGRIVYYRAKDIA